MELNEDIAELIGAIIGDGNIYRNKKKYRVGLTTGKRPEDYAHFLYLKSLISREWKKDPKIKSREHSFNIIIHSKEICLFLNEELGLPFGEGKFKKVKIPEPITMDWKLARRCIRGIVDTDGTVFAVKKPRVSAYPSIEITTCSKDLANQIRGILLNKGFRVANIWKFRSKLSKHDCYRLPLNGKENLKKWINEIGFSHPFKFNRAVSYLKRNGNSGI